MTPLELKEIAQAGCTANPFAAKICRYLTVLHGKCPKCGKKYKPNSAKK